MVLPFGRLFHRAGTAASIANVSVMKVLVFDDPTLPGRYEWLIDDGGDLHETMRALARQSYRRNDRPIPVEGLAERLRAHSTVDARPYAPPHGT
jgi:hypothetical protein